MELRGTTYLHLITIARFVSPTDIITEYLEGQSTSVDMNLFKIDVSTPISLQLINLNATCKTIRLQISPEDDTQLIANA
jgi:hypothetical protein